MQIALNPDEQSNHAMIWLLTPDDVSLLEKGIAPDAEYVGWDFPDVSKALWKLKVEKN